MHFFYLFIFAISVFLFSSCSSAYKPAAQKGGKNLFTTFYLGEQGNQYFIKPIAFYSKESKAVLKVDFTFRGKENKLADSAIFTFSYIESYPVKALDSVILQSISEKIVIQKPEKLFNQMKGKMFENRFQAKIPLIILRKMFKENVWQFVIVPTNNKKVVFNALNKQQKRLKKLDFAIFMLDFE